MKTNEMILSPINGKIFLKLILILLIQDSYTLKINT